MRWEELRHRTTEVAKNLRKTETSAEDVLWTALRGRRLNGLKFRRQHPIGGMVLDFSCPEYRLGIEVDGSVHDDQAEQDAFRTRYLNELGYRIIRIRNNEVLSNLNQVLQRILVEIHRPQNP